MKKVKGIGAKTAQRIIIDLQDKVGPETGGGKDVLEISSQHNTVKNEALLALATLGFDKSRVEKTLSRILENSNSEFTLEVLIKQALKEL
jgi:Holliday junction DNA helicase RuvA